MADGHDVAAGAVERGQHRVGVSGDARLRVVARQVHGDRAVASLLELRHDARPAGGAVPGAVHQRERRHGGRQACWSS